MATATQFYVKNTFLELVDSEASSSDDEGQFHRSSAVGTRCRAKSDSFVIQPAKEHVEAMSMSSQVTGMQLPEFMPKKQQKSCGKLGDTLPSACTTPFTVEEDGASTYAQDDATPRSYKVHLASCLNLHQTSSDEHEVPSADQRVARKPMHVTTMQIPGLDAERVQLAQGKKNSRIHSSRSNRTLARKLAEAAKTARSIRETEMARRHALRQQMNANPESLVKIHSPSCSIEEGNYEMEACHENDITMIVPIPIPTDVMENVAVPGSKSSVIERGLPSASSAMPGLPAQRLEHFSEKRSSAEFNAEDDGSGSHMNFQTADSRTTVMMRNIPNNYSRSMLLELLNRHDFLGKYDFIYLPIDFKTNLSIGYAFVNLCTSSDVVSFWNCFDGFKSWTLPSRKVCEVAWSGPQHQGLGPNIERYQKSPVMHANVPDDCKPVIFANGQRIPFPLSSKKIRAPRVRRHILTAHGFRVSAVDAFGCQQNVTQETAVTEDVEAIISGDEASWI